MRESAFGGQSRSDEISGGSPYGASTIAGADGSRLRARTNWRALAIKGGTSRSWRHG